MLIQKVFNHSSSTVTGAAIIIAGATLLNKFIGIARDRILAHYFGAGPVIDAYYAAFKIPDLIYNLLVVGALTAGFIPIFTKLYHRSEMDKSPAWHLANNILNILGVALAVCSLTGIVFAEPLSRVIAPGMAPETHDLLTMFMRVMFLSPAILGMSMAAGGILQSLRRFVLYSLAPILYNAGIILGALFTPVVGPIGLPLGVLGGALLHCGLQFYGAYHAGWRWQNIFDWRDADTRTVGKLMIPRTLALAVSNVNGIAVTMLASLLPAGSIAVYNYADNLQWVPIGVIGIPFALAAFPALSYAAAQKDTAGFVRQLASTARQILFLIIPFSLVLMLLRAQVVRVILGSGAFDWTATIRTADALAFFSLGLFAQALIPLFARAFFALENTKTPLVVGVISALTGIIAALLLMRPLGVAGLALSASIAAIVNLALLVATLRPLLGNLDEEKTLSSLWRIAVAGLLMAIVVQYLKYPLASVFDQRYFWGIFGQGFVAGAAGLIVYGLVCFGLKLPEFLAVKEGFRRRALRTENVPPAVVEGKE